MHEYVKLIGLAFKLLDLGLDEVLSRGDTSLEPFIQTIGFVKQSILLSKSLSVLAKSALG